MKLYIIPGACSLAAHIILREAGIAFDWEKVDGKTKRTEGGDDYLAVNPKGQVPALRLDDGEVLTENQVILQFLADMRPQAGLAPANGMERVRLQERLSFLSSELHKSFSPFFAALKPEGEHRDAALAKVNNRLDHAEAMLADGRDWLDGQAFGIADAYLFVLGNWTGPSGVGLGERPHLKAFMQRVGARPAVQAALRAEGLIQ
ncbi:MAG: glutathione transferase GstA [Pseudomonadota bacterium]|nr:glutathione transferase GstA [Pseudomonadota bacterium]